MKRIIIACALIAISGVSLLALEPGETQFSSKTWLRYGYQTTGGETEYSGFALARGYLVFKHQFTDRLSSKFNLDIYSSDKSSDGAGAGLKIKAAYLDYAAGEGMDIYAGVIKNYFGTVYDWDYLTVEKALEDAEGICASADAGVALVGEIPGGLGQYAAGIYNGEGYKKYFSNIDRHFTYSANLRLTPLEGLMLGGSARFARAADPADTTADPETVSRLDMAAVLNANYGPIDIWAEYLAATLDETSASGFMVMPTVRVLDDFRLLFRYDMWDPDSDAKADGHSRIIAGANYVLTRKESGSPETRLQLNWNRHQPEADGADPTDGITLQLRFAFSSNPF